MFFCMLVSNEIKIIQFFRKAMLYHFKTKYIDNSFFFNVTYALLSINRRIHDDFYPVKLPPPLEKNKKYSDEGEPRVNEGKRIDSRERNRK